VDDILKTQFDLPKGLSDHSKTVVTLKGVTKDAKGKDIDQTVDVHRVQILDPATGTGTFLAEVIKHIHKPYQGQGGMWSQYVAEHLIPRLNGFELLMASYAMAHLKLDLLLTETGYVKPANTADQRLRVYLTNSLEEHHPDTGTLFANWLSSEANEANHIKRDAPVMVVMGNPPYAVSSTNKSDWIQDLLADYKRDLNERNIQPLSDDYIKFIRYGQHFIDKNGEGVLAYISNNSFIDGIIHRQMRKHLLDSFDAIYILDLHGNAKKKETAPDGSADQNVFDIMQGVSINLFVKTGKKAKGALATVYHHELHGKREPKYQALRDGTLGNLPWQTLAVKAPEYFFVPKDFVDSIAYESGFKIDDFFIKNACGIVTARDDLLVHKKRHELEAVMYDLKNLSENEFRSKYNEKSDSRDWTLAAAKLEAANAVIKQVEYRPFDRRYIAYSKKSKGILSYPRNDVMQHMANDKDLALLICKQQSTFNFQHVFVTTKISDKCSVSLQTKEATYHFPLYCYPEENSHNTLEAHITRTPNLNPEILTQIADGMGLTFTPEPDAAPDTFAPIDLLDYI
jgi:predicted helicase